MYKMTDNYTAIFHTIIFNDVIVITIKQSWVMLPHKKITLCSYNLKNLLQFKLNKITYAISNLGNVNLKTYQF